MFLSFTCVTYSFIMIGFENRREGPFVKANRKGKPTEKPGALAPAQEGSPIPSPQEPIAWAM